ncbi:hypothetical protein [Actinokineospora globicatena]|uniref:hypothetical protein n=1 Tax=Actinokineospora globicatena TaxID=103729 RepID=UPI0020A42D12|nr:hypothetical protein [Actinokineospora globicatena]MCP2301971.1 hypothetical protein [Actinokineospora globicatena]GLW76367.1 hypothetical protein Aglo01_08490 [Actinokineospora globicatena]GLW83203.1 hypothetical protein Aglo02_08430 [Actinokineospora globicatena]
MDRPTTGKRRVRTGSVRVADLIRRQPEPGPDPVDAPVAFTPTVDTQSVRPAPEHEDGDEAVAASRTARLAKLTGLGVAVVTLCGAVAASTIIARDRDAARGSAVVAGQITGERALLPHQLGRVVAGEADTPVVSEVTGAASGSISPPPTSTSRPPTASGGPRRGTGDTNPARSERDQRALTSNRELVLEYYRLIEVNPRSAFELIAGDVLGTTLGEFLGSWTEVSRIEVLDVVERRDGVLAVIRIHLRDGVHLRVQQLLTVTRTVPQRIVDAELVSAQRD